jgi:solute carrier family 25 carnitine/acylcarnitine transporter 20/29
MATDVQAENINIMREAEPLKLQKEKANSGSSGAHDYKGFVAGVFSGIAKLSGVFQFPIMAV